MAAELFQVSITAACCFDGIDYQPGQVVDVPEERARDMVRRGLAQFVPAVDAGKQLIEVEVLQPFRLKGIEYAYAGRQLRMSRATAAPLIAAGHVRPVVTVRSARTAPAAPPVETGPNWVEHMKCGNDLLQAARREADCSPLDIDWRSVQGLAAMAQAHYAAAAALNGYRS